MEPFGPLQQSLGFGLLASLLFNANRGRSAEPKAPADFFPELKGPTKAVDPAVQARILKAHFRGLAMAHGKVIDPNKESNG